MRVTAPSLARFSARGNVGPGYPRAAVGSSTRSNRTALRFRATRPFAFPNIPVFRVMMRPGLPIAILPGVVTEFWRVS